ARRGFSASRSSRAVTGEHFGRAVSPAQGSRGWPARAGARAARPAKAARGPRADSAGGGAGGLAAGVAEGGCCRRRERRGVRSAGEGEWVACGCGVGGVADDIEPWVPALGSFFFSGGLRCVAACQLSGSFG